MSIFVPEHLVRYIDHISYILDYARNVTKTYNGSIISTRLTDWNFLSIIPAIVANQFVQYNFTVADLENHYRLVINLFRDDFE